jgi:hypothetical protein
VAGQPRTRAAGPVAFDGRYPDDWGLLLVMNDTAIEKVGAGGTAIMAHHARLLDIKAFVLRQRDELDAGGVLEFIEDPGTGNTQTLTVTHESQLLNSAASAT